MSLISRIKQYFTDSVSELRKVTWPTRRQMVELSGIVLVITLAVTIFLAILDWGFAAGYEQILNLLR